MAKADAVPAFEAAADAIVAGAESELTSLLDEHPELIGARSDRHHRATLLHYVSANGVEDSRQRTPGNIVRIAEVLLDAGAEVDAGLDGGTTLGLVATSVHPARAGVQLDLLDALQTAGASVDGLPGGWRPLPAALANGRIEAAIWLADHGARITLESAAGLGRLDAVRRLFDSEAADAALAYAAAYGHVEVIEFLLDRGADPTSTVPFGQTALHLAAHGAHLDAVELLLSHDAPLEARNRYGGTVLDQARWSAANDARGWGGANPGADYAPIIAALLAAGAVEH